MMRMLEGSELLHHMAAKSHLEGCKAVIEIDLVSPFILAEDSLNTVLHSTALNYKHGAQLVSYFVKLGVDPNKKNSYMESPLHLSLRVQNLRTAEQLLRCGADLMVELDGRNLLAYCVSMNNLPGANFVHQHDRKMIYRTEELECEAYDCHELVSWLKVVGKQQCGTFQSCRLLPNIFSLFVSKIRKIFNDW
ncbi:Hypothetical predicted protein [Cloeon dipterum]|nr:Hypothetical predicted protein [Cloeon dipterum]CAB3387310.1 Hypothetical predicted protein [Cloeon dipterum]